MAIIARHMRVNFDYQIFVSQEFGGISRYFASIVAELDKMAAIEPLVSAPLYINAYLPDLAKHLVLGRRIPKFRGVDRLSPLVGAMAFAAAWARPPAIEHRTYYGRRDRPGHAARTVLTVYDMIHERHAADIAPGDRTADDKRAAVAQADHVICISNHTRTDLMDLLGVPADKISVTHLGYTGLFGAAESNESAADFRIRVFGADLPYLLYVGNRDGYKNFLGLLEAYRSSAWLLENFAVLCLGGGPFTATETEALAGLTPAGRVRQVAGSDAMLAACYRNAAVFVYPSLYEGFGIPILEAMSLGCPVACGSTSSLPEVAGDGAAYFDAAQPESIRATLESVLSGQEKRDLLTQRGKTRSAQFSWARCAAETAAVYQRLLP